MSKRIYHITVVESNKVTGNTILTQSLPEVKLQLHDDYFLQERSKGAYDLCEAKGTNSEHSKPIAYSEKKEVHVLANYSYLS